MTLPPLDVLLSYAFHKTRDIAAVRAAIGPDAVLLIDSGAFTAHSTGKPISLKAYSEFLLRWQGTYSAAVTLDVIGDPVRTRTNTHALRALGCNVMPVHTIGAPLAEFDAAVREYGYVAVGGMVGTAKVSQAAYLAALTRRAREQGGSIHALGVGRPKLLRQVRPYSADTSTVSRSLLHGIVGLWDGSRLQAMPVSSDRASLVKHQNLLRGYGLDLTRMARGTALDPDYRTEVVKAGIWSTLVQGAWVRRGVPPTDRPKGCDSGLPGPRLCTALVTGEIVKAACEVAVAARAGEAPRIVPRLLPRTAVPA